MEDKKHSFMDQLNLFFMELPLGFSLKPIKKHKG